MGKASSNKKVARAARAGGGRISSGQPRSLLFPGTLALVFLLGIGLVVYARHDRNSDDMGGTPQIGDHIHQAIGFYACGEQLPDLPLFESTIGIHTHADGVIHIHPFSQLGVGANATLGRFLKDARDEGKLDVSLSNTTLHYLGETYKEGTTKCDGVKNPTLRVAYWPDVENSDSKEEITTGSFDDRRLTTNGAGITVYFGDPKADIPKPPSGANLAALGAADGGQVPNKDGVTSTTSASSTTVPGGATSTTAPAAASTTVAP